VQIVGKNSVESHLWEWKGTWIELSYVMCCYVYITNENYLSFRKQLLSVWLLCDILIILLWLNFLIKPYYNDVFVQEYEDISGNKARFQDSQFLVFVNRILAFLMSGLYLLVRRQPQHKTPLYKYVFCSLSNIMSSWCQYEALKYVSFPSQVKNYDYIHYILRYIFW